jgi:hypothetical protein
MRGIIQLLVAIALLTGGSSAHAAVTLNDLQIMGRALGFLNRPPAAKCVQA